MDQITKAVNDVISSGNYILGPEVKMFEDEFASYVGCLGSVGVATGTDALVLSLLAAGLGPGDVVATMANAGAYTTVAAACIGADSLFVDVSPDSFQMTLSQLRSAIAIAATQGFAPKAIVVTHLFGQLNPEIEQIAIFAKSKDIVLIEDCAQAIGARNDSKMAGNFGTLATFSFFPTKNLGANGDGGAVTSNDSLLLDRVKQLRQYGWGSKYSIELPFGRNSRLDEVQAAILRVKLPYLDKLNESRREIFHRYLSSAGKNVKFYSLGNQSYVAHLCPVTVEGYSQAELSEFFSARSISSSVHFPVPDHKQRIDIKLRNLVELPITEYACSNLVTIPIFPEMTENEIYTVCKALKELGD
jgi:dTDP-4-amino-4,6-dideoxygalactose transaminase